MTLTMTEQDFREYRNDDGGFCIKCGADAYGVEPDARRYECEGCGANAVYGIEELLMMGKITFKELAQ